MSSATYKPNGGVLGCPKILAKDFKDYSDDVNSRIDADGSLKRVYVAKLTDKEFDNDFDIYIEQHPDKVSIINKIFGPISKNHLNGTCYSVQIGLYQTDVIDLLNPEMGSAFYSASVGLILCFLLKNSPFKLRATDLCCSLNGVDFIISTNATEVYSFLGIDLTQLLQTHTKPELFQLIEQSWLYDPELILQLRETKTKDIDRPVFVDFMLFCQTHSKTSAKSSKTLEEVLKHFGKTEQYDRFVASQLEETRQKKLRSVTKDRLTQQFKNNGLSGKELGKQMNDFKEWILKSFQIDYDTWAISENLDIEAMVLQFQKLL